MKNIFTVDVEDGVSIAMRDVFNKQYPQTRRVVDCTKRILQLCLKHGVKGTFFVLGEVAEEFPDLVKEIALGGHELGVHGYHHLQFFRMTPKKAKEELLLAKERIEDIIGEEVIGHRAPAFSITPKTSWGLEVIAECGFKYDSSIMPISGKRYGWPGFPKHYTRITLNNGMSLIEMPLSTINVLGREVPIGGGGYLRMLPTFLTLKGIGRINNSGRGHIIYIHPYELDDSKYPDYYFDAMKEVDVLTRLKMKSNWWNRSKTYTKLEQILSNGEYNTMKAEIDNFISSDKKPVSILLSELFHK